MIRSSRHQDEKGNIVSIRLIVKVPEKVSSLNIFLCFYRIRKTREELKKYIRARIDPADPTNTRTHLDGFRDLEGTLDFSGGVEATPAATKNFFLYASQAGDNVVPEEVEARRRFWIRVASKEKLERDRAHKSVMYLRVLIHEEKKLDGRFFFAALHKVILVIHFCILRYNFRQKEGSSLCC